MLVVFTDGGPWKIIDRVYDEWKLVNQLYQEWKANENELRKAQLKYDSVVQMYAGSNE